MNGVSGRADGNSNAGTTRHSGSDACQSRLQPDQGSLVRRLEAYIRLFDALLRQNRALRQEMAVVINKVIVELALPYRIDSTPVSMTASFGVAIFPVDGQDYHELLKAADVTMYRNKASRSTVSSLARKPRGSRNLVGV